ncbi:MAG: F0F1 ATP synthase subunit epsilon [Clostridia bacterium]|nr:F0F1 ATP synthase subunit epsilon [Clostridia bacterium]
MNTYKLVIASPDGNLYDGQAVSLSLRGADGDLAILAGHIPFITSVKPGKCILETEDGEIKEGRIEGGLLTVSGSEVILLSSGFSW